MIKYLYEAKKPKELQGCSIAYHILGAICRIDRIS